MGSARNALKEVQSRAADMKRIEQTITELAQLFNDVRPGSSIITMTQLHSHQPFVLTLDGYYGRRTGRRGSTH